LNRLELFLEQSKDLLEFQKLSLRQLFAQLWAQADSSNQPRLLSFKNESTLNISDEIGLRVRKYRLMLGMTQPELAKRAGLSRGTIHNLENRTAKTSLEVMIRVAIALDFVEPLSELFNPQLSDVDQMHLDTKQRGSRHNRHAFTGISPKQGF
jgi:transcriptional regulator with XRE-family HTH domain